MLSVDFWTARTHIPTCVALEQRTGEGAAYGIFFGPGKVLWKQQKKHVRSVIGQGYLNGPHL